jgi:cell division protein FtsB
MKKVIFFIILILCLFIINNFFHSIYRLWQKQDLITSARRELARETQAQKKLEQELSRMENPSYIEEEARNKLLLIKPGEQVVIVPEPTQAPQDEQKPSKKPAAPWEQWYQLFF